MNYSILVDETLRSSVDKVAYITLNYDLLMERAISEEQNAVFSNVDNYIPPDERWLYVKLHGSSNWGRRLNSDLTTKHTLALPPLLDLIERIDLKNDLQKEIEVDLSYMNRPNQSSLMFPAITVPADSKYEFNCPEKHIESLSKFLNECTDYLFIGTSVKDEDLLDLLNKEVRKVTHLSFVGGSNAEANIHIFRRTVPVFMESDFNTYSGGFSEFIASDGIDQFLDHCRSF